jgi:hypothetical protein
MSATLADNDGAPPLTADAGRSRGDARMNMDILLFGATGMSVAEWLD